MPRWLRSFGRGSRLPRTARRHSREDRLSHYHRKWTNEWGQVTSWAGSVFPQSQHIHCGSVADDHVPQKVKGLMIAAGQGMRLRAQAEAKPLVSLLGVPLIERVVRCALEGGVDELYVVTGYEGEKVAGFLSGLGQRLGCPLTILRNDEWQEENGLSVLIARGLIEEPFLLMMADHLCDPLNIRTLREHEIDDGQVLLAVDSDVGSPLVEMADATKVRVEDGLIRDIGKNISDFNCFDTGLFLCTPAIFAALEQTCRYDHDTTLSAAVQLLAREGRAKAVAVQGYWVDVDDKNAHRRAVRTLLASSRGKLNDGPISRWVNRPISTRLTRLLVEWSVTPNQLSVASFVLAAIAAALFTLGSYGYLVLGGVLAQLASIVDGVDGEIARLKYLSSDYGRWLDAVLDRYADALLLGALTWHAYGLRGSPWVFGVGVAAIVGSFMVSYTADKYDALMRDRAGSGVRIGRDLRLALIFLGALANQVLWLLVVIAVVMNVEAVRRIVVCRDDE